MSREILPWPPTRSTRIVILVYDEVVFKLLLADYEVFCIRAKSQLWIRPDGFERAETATDSAYCETL